MSGSIHSVSDGGSDLHGHLHVPLTETDKESTTEFQADPEAWRNEVAARLARYRTRRKPRPPRYPSLLLPFDSLENRSRPAAPIAAPDFADSVRLEHDCSLPEFESADDFAGSAPPFSKDESAPPPSSPPEMSAKIIEFPRSAAIPAFHTSILADPIFDCPRIVEAPEVVPPPPALGGILIEPTPSRLPDAATSLDSRIDSASMSRRLLAILIDGLILSVAFGGFAAIFLRLNPARGPVPLLAGTAAGLAVLLWMAYQYLFVIYTGSTPGLRAARLRLTTFDGASVSLDLRRWRVLASFLSAFSAGLGYLWGFLDQDSLCWHDRTTRTYLQHVKVSKPAPSVQ
jgi:uncharacterized RDD family membrane protein YckC